MSQVILVSSRLFDNLRSVVTPTRLALLVAEINRSPTLVRDLQQLELIDKPLVLSGGSGTFNPADNTIAGPSTAAQSRSDQYAVEAFLGGVIHEVGHFVNRAADNKLWLTAKDPQDTYQSCFATEGRAIMYSAAITGESRASGSPYTLQVRWGDNPLGDNSKSTAAIFRATETIDREYPALTPEQRDYAIATLVGYQYGLGAQPSATDLGNFSSYVGYCEASARRRFPADQGPIDLVPGPIRPGPVLDNFGNSGSGLPFPKTPFLH
jgi:hypothetical protein